ncbi:MAG: hypothetical protein F2881_02285 [Actinobacteria bacterium]|nr:hypothetical protein [Actinomycetota bacterium]
MSRSSTEPHGLWDEALRPTAPSPPSGWTPSGMGSAVGSHLVDVHDHLRHELARLLEAIDQVREGRATTADARQVMSELTLSQHDWAVGAYCARYCSVVTQHHGIEDAAVFPHLRAANPELAPVIDRLQDEHVAIHGVLVEVDRLLVEYMGSTGDVVMLQAAVGVLAEALVSHLAYEEHEVIPSLQRFGMFPGQV